MIKVLSSLFPIAKSQPLHFTSILLISAPVFITSGCLRQLPLSPQKVNYALLRYTNNGEADTINKFPDFSFAGYERNQQAIPLIPVKAVVYPEPGDDGDRIQQAINRIARLPEVNGFRGAVLLKAGKYEVANTILITKSGIVLRGEGQGNQGTVITATSRLSSKEGLSLIKIQGVGNGIKETGIAKSEIANYVPIGANYVPIVDAIGFHVGDTIEIRKMVNDEWIQMLGMKQYGWKASQYRIAHRRVIKKIEGDTLYFDIPIVDAIYQQFGGGYVETISLPGRISHCGVENMRLQSVYANDEDEMHAYSAVTLSHTINSWVRNVTALYFVFGCVNIANRSDFNTVQDCAMLDPKAQSIGGRKYSFYVDVSGGMGNLFQRCFSRNARHDFAVSAFVTGPNAFVDCYAENAQLPSGPHHRWSTGTLFDNIHGGIMNAHNAKSRGTGHGWEGAQTLFWNCDAYYMNVSSPPGAINWAIGCISNGAEGDGYWLSPGIHVKPRSLFFDQLEQRAGKSALSNIAIPSQLRSTDIWEDLRQWAGSKNSLKPSP